MREEEGGGKGMNSCLIHTKGTSLTALEGAVIGPGDSALGSAAWEC